LRVGPVVRIAAIGCLLLPGLGLGLGAAAQPRLVPTGDVDVLYQVDGAAAQQIPGGAAGGVRLMWDAAGDLLGGLRDHRSAAPLGGTGVRRSILRSGAAAAGR
jgi:hypothetical protein